MDSGGTLYNMFPPPDQPCMNSEQIAAELALVNAADYKPKEYQENSWPATITKLLTNWRFREEVHFEWCQTLVDAAFRDFEIELKRLCIMIRMKYEELPIHLYNKQTKNKRAAIQLSLAQQKRIENIGKEEKIEVLQFLLQIMPLNPKLGGSKIWAECSHWKSDKNVEDGKSEKKSLFYCVGNDEQHESFLLVLDEEKKSVTKGKIRRTHPTYKDIESYLIPLIYDFPWLQLPPVEIQFYQCWSVWADQVEEKKSAIKDYRCDQCRNYVGDFRLFHSICRQKIVSCFDCYYHKLPFLDKLRDTIFGRKQRTKRPQQKNEETALSSFKQTSSDKLHFQLPFFVTTSKICATGASPTLPTPSSSSHPVGSQETGQQQWTEVIQLDDSEMERDKVSGGQAKLNLITSYCEMVKKDIEDLDRSLYGRVISKLRSVDMLFSKKAPTILDDKNLEIQRENLKNKKNALLKEADSKAQDKNNDANTYLDTVWSTFDREVDQTFYVKSFTAIKNLSDAIKAHKDREEDKIKEEIDALEAKLKERLNDKSNVKKIHHTPQEKNTLSVNSNVQSAETQNQSSEINREALHAYQNSPNDAVETPNHNLDTPDSFGRSQESVHEVLSLETQMQQEYVQQDPRQPGPSSQNQYLCLPFQGVLIPEHVQRQNNPVKFRQEASMFQSGPLNLADVPRQVPQTFGQMAPETARQQYVREDQRHQHNVPMNLPRAPNFVDNDILSQQHFGQQSQQAPAEQVLNHGLPVMQNGGQNLENFVPQPAQNFQLQGQDRPPNPNSAAANQGIQPIYNYGGLVREQDPRRFPPPQVVAEQPAALNGGFPIMHTGHQGEQLRAMHQPPSPYVNGGHGIRGDPRFQQRPPEMMAGNRQMMQGNQQLNRPPYAGHHMHHAPGQAHPYMRPPPMAPFPPHRVPMPPHRAAFPPHQPPFPPHHPDEFQMNPPPRGYNEYNGRLQ